MKRPDGPPPGGTSHTDWSPPDDRAWRETYPTLWEFLTAVRYEDGTARETATLLILIESGFWKGQLRDRDLQRALWRAGATLEEVLMALELAAGDSRCGDWRAFQGQFTPKTRKSR